MQIDSPEKVTELADSTGTTKVPMLAIAADLWREIANGGDLRNPDQSTKWPLVGRDVQQSGNQNRGGLSSTAQNEWSSGTSSDMIDRLFGSLTLVGHESDKPAKPAANANERIEAASDAVRALDSTTLAKNWDEAYKKGDFAAVNKQMSDAIKTAFREGGMEAVQAVGMAINKQSKTADAGPLFIANGDKIEIHNSTPMADKDAAKLSEKERNGQGVVRAERFGVWVKDLGKPETVAVLTEGDSAKIENALLKNSEGLNDEEKHRLKSGLQAFALGDFNALARMTEYAEKSIYSGKSGVAFEKTLHDWGYRVQSDGLAARGFGPRHSSLTVVSKDSNMGIRASYREDTSTTKAAVYRVEAVKVTMREGDRSNALQVQQQSTDETQVIAHSKTMMQRFRHTAYPKGT